MPNLRVALVTGASAGLGSEYAKLFAADGHDVVMVARRRERLDAIAKELREARGRQAHVIAADLSSPAAAGESVGEGRPARLPNHVLGDKPRLRTHRALPGNDPPPR